MLDDPSYSILSNSNGIKRISTWNPPTTSFKTLRMNIINVMFAISYSINGTLYMLEGGSNYTIEKYTIKIQLTPLVYDKLTTQMPFNNLKMGLTTNNLTIFSQCSSAMFNNGTTKKSYF